MSLTFNERKNFPKNGMWKEVPSYYEPYTTFYYVPAQSTLPKPGVVVDLIKTALDGERDWNIRYKCNGTTIRVYGENEESCVVEIYRTSLGDVEYDMIEFRRMFSDGVIPFSEFYNRISGILFQRYPSRFVRSLDEDTLGHLEDVPTNLDAPMFKLQILPDEDSSVFSLEEKSGPVTKVDSGFLVLPTQELEEKDGEEESTFIPKTPYPSPSSRNQSEFSSDKVVMNKECYETLMSILGSKYIDTQRSAL